MQRLAVSGFGTVALWPSLVMCCGLDSETLRENAVQEVGQEAGQMRAGDWMARVRRVRDTNEAAEDPVVPLA